MKRILRGTLEQKFWSRTKVRAPDECWPWLGGVQDRGYGHMRHAGKTLRAHRVSFYVAFGVEPAPGLVVMHKCDNPICVNPRHLVLGTQGENIADRVAKKRTRAVVGEAQGLSKLTAAAVVAIRESECDLSSLARRYGVSKSAISRVLLRHTWKHL